MARVINVPRGKKIRDVLKKRNVPRNVVLKSKMTKYYKKDGTITLGYRTPKVYGYVYRGIKRTYAKNVRNDRLGRSGKSVRRPILTRIVLNNKKKKFFCRV